MNYLRRIIQMFVLLLFPFSAIGCLMLGSSELIGESSEAKEWAVSIEEFLKLCVTGTTEEIQKAIDNGADVNSRTPRGLTPLMHAAHNENPKVIPVLLEAGADVEVRDDIFGWTALMRAAEKNVNPEMISVLLEAGADIEARDESGWTVLMYAAESNENPEVISVLLEAGASIEARANGWTALMHAAGFNENPKVIHVLLEAGADAKARSIEGKRAIDYAEENEDIKGTEAYWKLYSASY